MHKNGYTHACACVQTGSVPRGELEIKRYVCGASPRQTSAERSVARYEDRPGNRRGVFAGGAEERHRGEIDVGQVRQDFKEVVRRRSDFPVSGASLKAAVP